MEFIETIVSTWRLFVNDESTLFSLFQSRPAIPLAANPEFLVELVGYRTKIKLLVEASSRLSPNH